MSVTTLPAARTVPEQAKPPKVARRWATVFAGRPDDPSWARPGLWALLLGTALLYLWDLSSSGFANTFYAAAVQAGSQDLKAWFFGSLDASNFITVDKPPASLWVMGLSARLFGFSSWSLLIPQALMGVGTVALIHASVRRVSGHGAALAAGLVMALTPAAALMFRFDNPDALLVLLMTAAGYFVTRAQEKASGRWLALAGVALGFAFLTKMLQGLLVLPAFALVYLITAPASVRKRLLHLVVAGLTLIASAGWWVVIVALWPAGSRPYIGGSTNNSVIDLVLGYNGLGRIFGQGAGGAGGGGGGGGNGNSGFGGATGLGRMFTSEIGLEISWLLPSALIALALGLYVTRPATRTDSQRAALLMWGGWLIVTGLIFSNMRGTMHPYYTVALAPAIAAILGITVSLLWRIRGTATGSLGFASLIAAAGIWSFSLLADSGSSLRWVLLAVTAASALILCLHAVMGLSRLVTSAVIVGMVFSLGGTAAYTVDTALTAHSGSIPTVSMSGSGGMGGGGMGGAMGGGPGQSTTDSSTSTNSSSSSSASSVEELLAATTSRWSAAVNGSQSAATLELSSNTSVMAIGGWSGDPTPTLAEFQAYVKAGDVSYYISSGQGGGPGGSSSSSSAIATWVADNYTATTVGNSTVYDLSS